MILFYLLLLPLTGVLFLSLKEYTPKYNQEIVEENTSEINSESQNNNEKKLYIQKIKNQKVRFLGIAASILNLILTLYVFILFDFSTLKSQFIVSNISISNIIKIAPHDFFVGVDGSSIYFVLLTALIIPIAILSNWKSIKKDVISYIVIMLLLETLLLAVFFVLDILYFYIFFESILPPLFILIGLFGSTNKIKAGFYLFLYTLLGSLFLLLSILSISSLIGVSEYNAIYKINIPNMVQVFLFIGIFIAFAVKTPTIFLNIWLLKAHVESPLGGSIILAAIVLKLSLYGIIRLVLPITPDATFILISVVFVIAVISIIYASISTLRTVDIKELIAYSSVSHAQVYLLGIFSNVLIGLQGAIILGLAHGFVSSGLFTSGGGILYDRSGTRLMYYYRGMSQVVPMFGLSFFILCLGNSGTPLTLNFIGEFMSLYGAFENSPFFGALACSSIVFSAAYTFNMYNRISFGGSYSRYFKFNFSDLSFRENTIIFILIAFTIILGIYPSVITDGISYCLSALLYQNYSSITLLSLLPLVITKKSTGIRVTKSHIKHFSCTAKASARKFISKSDKAQLVQNINLSTSDSIKNVHNNLTRTQFHYYFHIALNDTKSPEKGWMSNLFPRIFDITQTHKLALIRWDINRKAIMHKFKKGELSHFSSDEVAKCGAYSESMLIRYIFCRSEEDIRRVDMDFKGFIDNLNNSYGSIGNKFQLIDSYMNNHRNFIPLEYDNWLKRNNSLWFTPEEQFEVFRNNTFESYLNKAIIVYRDKVARKSAQLGFADISDNNTAPNIRDGNKGVNPDSPISIFSSSDKSRMSEEFRKSRSPNENILSQKDNTSNTLNTSKNAVSNIPKDNHSVVITSQDKNKFSADGWEYIKKTFNLRSESPEQENTKKRPSTTQDTSHINKKTRIQDLLNEEPASSSSNNSSNRPYTTGNDYSSGDISKQASSSKGKGKEIVLKKEIKQIVESKNSNLNNSKDYLDEMGLMQKPKCPRLLSPLLTLYEDIFINMNYSSIFKDIYNNVNISYIFTYILQVMVSIIKSILKSIFF